METTRWYFCTTAGVSGPLLCVSGCPYLVGWGHTEGRLWPAVQQTGSSPDASWLLHFEVAGRSDCQLFQMFDSDCRSWVEESPADKRRSTDVSQLPSER